MKLRQKLIWALLSLVFLSQVVAAQETKVPTPQEIVGFEIGTDRNLADWNQIVAYFQAVASASGRVQLVELGRSPEDRPMIAAYISSETNIARLPELLKAQRDLTYSPESANETELLSGHSLFVLISCSIHSTEIGASQMAMKLLYGLATGECDLSKKIRDRLVVILIPSPNPDGLNMVVEWYRRWLGTEYEGCSPPRLYQEYAGHDNNRDWYMLNLEETKIVNRWISEVWFAPVIWDAHQMGSTGFRAIVPPFRGPPNPFIHPLVLEGIANAGHAMKAQAIRQGHKGMAHRTHFSVWWNGGFRTTPYFKNSIGLLTELASCKLATPIEVTAEQLAERKADQKTVNNPAPWQGGQWGIGDIVGVETALATGLLRYCARNADLIIADYRHMCLDASAAKDGGPAAYLLPIDQHDRAALYRMVELLADHGIQVDTLVKDRTIGGKEYREGTIVVSGFQPFRPFIRSMFERLYYPATGDGARPYDISGWTVADQFGLDVYQICMDEWGKSDISDVIKPYEAKQAYPLSTSTGETVYPAGDTDSYLMINRILTGGGVIYREYPREGYMPESQSFIQYDPNRDASGYDISGKIQEAKDMSMKLPRLALLRGFLNSMDEGWTRYLLDQHGFPYSSLDEKRVKEGALENDFDAVIIPNVRGKTLIEGRQRDDYPPEFRGGIGEDGLKNLDSFVKNGGTLISIGGSCRTLIDKLKLPVVDLLKGVKPEELNIPGSLILMKPNLMHPVAFGMDEKVAAMFIRSLAFDIPEENKENVEVVARWADKDLLVSGYAKGEELLAGKAAVVVVHHGKGRIVLIGFPCQFRAQPYSTFKLLLNAIYFAGEFPEQGVRLSIEPLTDQ